MELLAKDLSGAELTEICTALKILSNPQRLKILMLLSQGECSVSGIEEITGIKQPTLSHELRKLREGGVVLTRKQSKVVFYSMESGMVSILLNKLMGVSNENGRVHGLMDHQPVSVLSQGECGHFPVINKQTSLTG